jgi:ferredoxin-NADP reductase
MEIMKFSSKLSKKKQLAGETYEFHFDKPTGFQFLAGQFLQFCIPQNEKITLRSYSLSSTPSDPSLEFCVKFLEGGIASNYLKNMNIGDSLDFQGPRGLFVHKENGTALSLIATGTGIAPIMGIIRDELKNKKNTQEVRLLFGVRSEEDVFWLDRFENLKKQYPNFVYNVSLSQPKVDGSWVGLRGRVTEHILHHLVSHKFYLCGNAAMVKDVRAILLENGVDMKAIHFEIF